MGKMDVSLSLLLQFDHDGYQKIFFSIESDLKCGIWSASLETVTINCPLSAQFGQPWQIMAYSVSVKLAWAAETKFSCILTWGCQEEELTEWFCLGIPSRTREKTIRTAHLRTPLVHTGYQKIRHEILIGTMVSDLWFGFSSCTRCVYFSCTPIGQFASVRNPRMLYNIRIWFSLKGPSRCQTELPLNGCEHLGIQNIAKALSTRVENQRCLYVGGSM